MIKTLLLVDDEPAILNSLKRMLRHSDYNILTANSGAEALETLQKNNNIQVVLTDYRMPNMTGAELLSEIKKRFSTVIGLILSGHSDHDILLEVINSGIVYKFLTKPWNNKELSNTVEQAFDQYNLLQSQNKPPLGIKQLLSRKSLLQELDHWMAAGIDTIAFYLDIRNFHSYNDSLGYETSDQLLTAIAHLLVVNKPNKSLIGHMNGDEFVIILPKSSCNEEKQQIITELLLPFQESVHIAGRDLHIAFNVGYGISPNDGDTPALLLRNAYAAVNHSKQNGSTVYPRYSVSMNNTSQQTMLLRSDLHKALERNELSVVYQPKVCMITRNIVGAECLLRWKHGSVGMVPPSIFIPLAEASGLIESIGEWVLLTACNQSNLWIQEGLPPFLMSVNISGRQLQHKTLMEKINNTVKLSGVNPEQLELEITETFLMQDINSSLALLHEIKKLGIHLAIDDFGTGYSSLNYLSQLPVNTLKIDRSFVIDLPELKERENLLRNLIRMSHDLDMSVVAEGVETQAQFNKLKELKCDEIQGYFYSPPVSPDKFRTLLENQPLIGVEYQPA